MDIRKLKEKWIQEEKQAHIHGWDFSHIRGRYEEENDFPWDYAAIIRSYLKDNFRPLDMDTGGGEFLLSLRHPHMRTSATEGYLPNVQLCREKLLPLGIDFREMKAPSQMPFESGQFDMVINRHGDYCISELFRVLKKGNLNLPAQRALFQEAGFEILKTGECFRPIRFFDVGALVWFARIIEWEFPGFSVDNCLEQLIKAQEILEKNGVIEGTIHRYLIVGRK